MEKKSPSDEYSYLKAFNLLWFDPNIDSSENHTYQLEFNKLFAKCSYCRAPEEVKALIDKDTTFKVVISCGSSYTLIRELVEDAAWVRAIFIFCFDIQKHTHYKQECSKVLDVSNAFDSLKVALKKVYHDCDRMAHFFETRSQRTFYTLKDAENLKAALKVSFNEDCYSVFFPIGFKSVNIKEFLTKELLDAIYDTALKDDLMKPYHTEIKERIKELKADLSQANILRSYTDNGLYKIFNQYIRYGEYVGLKLFREYLFCLKGAMVELGDPMVSKAILYRGLTLKKTELEQWEENKGNLALFSAFTSTSKIKSQAEGFKGVALPDEVKILLKIEVTDNFSEFKTFLKKFRFIEDCGIFYPTSIQNYSKYPAEEEVLFPAFYPFKIIDINHTPAGAVIRLLTPARISLSNTKEGMEKFWKGKGVENWLLEYSRRTCQLVKAGLLDDAIFRIFIEKMRS